MSIEIKVTDYQLHKIENGVPLCVGGPNLAIYLTGTRPDLPAWVTVFLPITSDLIAKLRSDGRLGGRRGYDLRLI